MMIFRPYCFVSITERLSNLIVSNIRLLGSSEKLFSFQNSDSVFFEPYDAVSDIIWQHGNTRLQLLTCQLDDTSIPTVHCFS